METPIKVVFRRFKEGGVIALFPYIPWNESENTITSYLSLIHIFFARSCAIIASNCAITVASSGMNL